MLPYDLDFSTAFLPPIPIRRKKRSKPKPPRPPRPPAPKRTPVLITIEDGQHVTVYGHDTVDVLVLNLPCAESVSQELKREAMLDEMLPQRYKDIHWPGMIRKRGKAKQLTLFDIAEKVQTLEMLELFSAPNERKRHPKLKQKQLAIMKA